MQHSKFVAAGAVVVTATTAIHETIGAVLNTSHSASDCHFDVVSPIPDLFNCARDLDEARACILIVNALILFGKATLLVALMSRLLAAISNRLPRNDLSERSRDPPPALDKALPTQGTEALPRTFVFCKRSRPQRRGAAMLQLTIDADTIIIQTTPDSLRRRRIRRHH
jgi:hypothetical protein